MEEKVQRPEDPRIPTTVEEKVVQIPEDPRIPPPVPGRGCCNDDGGGEGRRRRSRAKKPYYTPDEIHELLPENILDAAPSYVRVMAGLPSWREVYAAREAKRDAIIARNKEEKRMRRWDVRAMRALRRWCSKLGCTSVAPPPPAPKAQQAQTRSQPRVTTFVLQPGCSPRKLEPVSGSDGTVTYYLRSIHQVIGDDLPSY